jgi:hypothetical protein
MNAILILNPCARCKHCPTDYCASCDNFLCSDCWSLIHSFKPLDKHTKGGYDRNPKIREELVQQMEQSILQLKQIDSSLKEISVKKQTLEVVYKLFNNYRAQLNAQLSAVEQYINEHTDTKVSQLLNHKCTFKGHLDLCKEALFDHNGAEIRPIDSYISDLEYKFTINDQPLHQIISFDKSPSVSSPAEAPPVLSFKCDPGPEQIIVDGDLKYVRESNGCQNWFKKGIHHRVDGPAIIFADGAESWYEEGKLHRDDDLPAVIRVSGEKQWYQKGKLHREGDQPAIIHPTRGEQYYLEGLLHRDGDKPAWVSNERQEWFQKGLLHREGDQPAVIDCDRELWYQKGQLHRDGDRPACIYKNGRREYYRHGILHREKGPAVICNDHCTHFYVDGKQIL